MDINGLKIRQLALQKKIRHKVIADKLGISKQNWSNALYRNSLKDELLPRLCAILQINQQEIALESLDDKTNNQLPNQNPQSETSEIIALARESIRLANGMMERFDRAMDAFEQSMAESKPKSKPAKERTGTSG